MQHTKYYKWYKLLIQKACERGGVEGYSERHHIIPRSLGGGNTSSNLVALTAREHYMSHLLLFKHYKSIGNSSAMYKMGLAIQLMKNGKSSPLSTFSSGAKSSVVYAAVKEAISSAMTGTGNPMYGKVSQFKGKTHKEMYSKASLQRFNKAVEARRKFNYDITWVKEGIKETCTVYELRAKYPDITSHIYDVIDPTTPRKVCKGWSIFTRDSRNAWIRERSTAVHKFYRLDKGLVHECTIDNLLGKYPDLSYRGIRNLVFNYKSGEYSCKSYKGWMLYLTYLSRRPLWELHNTQFTWVERSDNKVFKATITEVSNTFGIDKGKVVAIYKGTRTSSKIQIKEVHE